MGIVKRTKDGKTEYGVSRRLPPNRLGMKRFRRWYERRAIARNVLDRLNGAIAKGEIDDILPGLVGKRMDPHDCTIAEFWLRFRDEYCQKYVPSWKRYEQSFNFLLDGLGGILLRDFRRAHLYEWLQKRTKAVSTHTANRDISALSKMFTYALEVEAVDFHPLSKFPKYDEPEQMLRIPHIKEFRAYVDALSEEDAALAAMMATIGETGIRISEARNTQWPEIDFRQKRITVKGKGEKVRALPLSDWAIDRLRSVTRFVGNPYVFCHQVGAHRGMRIFKPYEQIERLTKKLGLDWIKPHRLRHMRATRWLQLGVDIKSVKEKLGHRAIATTNKYTKFIETHADEAIRRAQQVEQEISETASEREKSGTQEE